MKGLCKDFISKVLKSHFVIVYFLACKASLSATLSTKNTQILGLNYESSQ